MEMRLHNALTVNSLWFTVNDALIKADVYPLSENQQTKLLLPFLWTVPYMASNVRITKNIKEHLYFKSPRYWGHFSPVLHQLTILSSCMNKTRTYNLSDIESDIRPMLSLQHERVSL